MGTESDETTTSDSNRTEPRPPTLPFSRWWPLLAGALMGVALRLVFAGSPGGPYAPMQGAFIYLVPIAVGAFTVYVAETKQRRGWGYYAWAPVIANTLFVTGTMIILIEGLICAIIILPLFVVLGAVGGLLMGAICRATRWPRHAVYSFAVLPIVLGIVPTHEQEHQRLGTVERSLSVPAAPEIVWRQIHDARDIRPDEVDAGWIYRIGVPLPLAGVTQQTPTERVRKITMGKSIHFDQVVVEWQDDRHVRWTYRFHDDSFPPRALDDHVRIGGHYFDLIDTAYTLTPAGDGQATVLTVRMSYRVSTQFNWYADGVARLLIGNFEEVILKFYQRRAIGATAEPAAAKRSG